MMFALHRLRLSICPGRYTAAEALAYAQFAIVLHARFRLDPSRIVDNLAVDARIISDSGLYPGIIAQA